MSIIAPSPRFRGEGAIVIDAASVSPPHMAEVMSRLVKLVRTIVDLGAAVGMIAARARG